MRLLFVLEAALGCLTCSLVVEKGVVGWRNWKGGRLCFWFDCPLKLVGPSPPDDEQWDYLKHV